MPPPLHGLLLCGGRSRRMGFDKAAFGPRNEARLTHLLSLLQSACDATFLSCRPGQYDNTPWSDLPQVHDQRPDCGPISGIYAALQQGTSAWLVLACDLPHMDDDTIAALASQRDPGKMATVYRHACRGEGPGDQLEPLCAIYEPACRDALQTCIAEKNYALHPLLRSLPVHFIDTASTTPFTNINRPEDWEA